MDYKYLDKQDKDTIKELFTSVFTSSEGKDEGLLVGELSSKLASGIDNQTTFCLGAYIANKLVGSIFFTRLAFNTTEIKVYMLAPVAVSTQHQHRGVGKSLINFGLNELKRKGVDVVITYGDPSFYSKVGFIRLPQSTIQPPLKLSMPEGWLGQSLTNDTIPVIKERPTCVKAFNNPAYW